MMPVAVPTEPVPLGTRLLQRLVRPHARPYSAGSASTHGMCASNSICTAGRAVVRTVRYLAAMSGVRCNLALRALSRRPSRGKPREAALTTSAPRSPSPQGLRRVAGARRR